jgi:protein-tyrosine phosphatase
MTKILMVCLGNICRSPLAEGILRKKIATHFLTDIEVDSAGTSAYHIGEHPDERSIANAQKHGVDISLLKARQFSVKDFDVFDMIYVMDSSNYNDVIARAQNASDRQKVNLILNELAPGSNRSVPDPYFGGKEGFEIVYRLLDDACEIIVQKLMQPAKA